MKKRFTSVLLVIAMFAVMVVPAKAEGVYNLEGVEPTDIYSHVAEAVALDVENPFSPLQGHSLDELAFGDIILTYSYINNSIQENHANYIPIFNNNTLLAMAFVSFFNTNFNVEITTDLVQELVPFVNCDISLIFGATNTYVYSNKATALLKSYAHLFTQTDEFPATISETEFEADSVEDICDLTGVLSDSLSAKYKISSFEFPSNTTSPPMRASYPVNWNIGATIIQQYGEPVCWAASVASIGLELTGKRKTAEAVAKWYLGEDNWRDGATPYEALLVLQELYGLDGVDMYYAPDFETIMDETSRVGNPIYVRVRGGRSGLTYKLSHALFIDGYTDYASGSYIGCIFLGDPNYTKYRTVYFSSDGDYPYTLNGITGYIDAYLKLY